MKSVNIMVIGSYLTGLTMQVERFPGPGETLIGRNFSQLHGGKGSNQAVACARLGARVRFATCVGRDAMGQAALDLYRDEGVDASPVHIADERPTGVGFVVVSDGGENLITLDLGACLSMTPERVETLEDDIQWADIVLCQLEIPLNTVCAAANIAWEAGKPFLLNPAPYQSLPLSLTAVTDVITPNETEARMLCGLAPDEDIPLDELGRQILTLGPKAAVITLGKRGAYYCTRDGEHGHLPAREVVAVDTTGAGDTFSAALAVALAEGRDLPGAIHFAQAATSFAVTKYGVIESLPMREDVDTLITSEREA